MCIRTSPLPWAFRLRHGHLECWIFPGAGRWASNYAFAVSRGTAAAHSLLRKSWVGARDSDYPHGDGTFGEFSRFFVHFRRRWHGSQRPGRFLPGARNRECFFPGLRSFAGSWCESGRGPRGTDHTEAIDRRRSRAEQDLWTDGCRKASPLHRPSSGHARSSHPTLRLRLAL